MLFSKASFSASTFSLFSLYDWRYSSISPAFPFLSWHLYFFLPLFLAITVTLVPLLVDEDVSKVNPGLIFGLTPVHSLISCWNFHDFQTLPVWLLLSSISFCLISSFAHLRICCGLIWFFVEIVSNQFNSFKPVCFFQTSSIIEVGWNQQANMVIFPPFQELWALSGWCWSPCLL